MHGTLHCCYPKRLSLPFFKFYNFTIFFSRKNASDFVEGSISTNIHGMYSNTNENKQGNEREHEEFLTLLLRSSDDEVKRNGE